MCCLSVQGSTTDWKVVFLFLVQPNWMDGKYNEKKFKKSLGQPVHEVWQAGISSSPPRFYAAEHLLASQNPSPVSAAHTDVCGPVQQRREAAKKKKKVDGTSSTLCLSKLTSNMQETVQQHMHTHTRTFSFSWSTSRSFLLFQLLNFSESSLICFIRFLRWTFMAWENSGISALNAAI